MSSEEIEARTTLKTYKVFTGKDYINGDGYLVFANNIQQSKKVYYNYVVKWINEDLLWIDINSKLIKGKNFLYMATNELMIRDNVPHIITSPCVCSVCGHWECDGRSHEGEEYFATEGME